MKPGPKIITIFFMLILFLSACAPQAEPVIPPTATSTPAPTATPTSIPTPIPPMLVVGGDIPCYAGPGPDYEKLSLISIGMKAEVLSKDSTGEYWIVKAPDGNSQCWIESKYSTIIGQAEAIPTLSADAVPTPKPVIPAAPKNLTASAYCLAQLTTQYDITLYINLDWLESKDETGYRLYKDGKLVTELEVGNTGFTDKFLFTRNLAGKFVYTLEAFNKNGTSPTIEAVVEIPVHMQCQRKKKIIIFW